MKFARYFAAGRERCGIVADAAVQDVSWGMRDLLVLSANGRLDAVSATGPMRSIEDVRLLPPIPADGRGVFCVGLNYVEHQRESADVFLAEAPEHPVIFFKQPAALVGHDEPLDLPESMSDQWDWEVELGVVIGAPAASISADDAWSVIAGYTVVNDITARDLQTRHTQWFLGKNGSASTPVGPWVVTQDEVGSPPDLELALWVNGDRKQKGRTTDLVFDIPTLIATISKVTPLLPGDIIATGTPSGVGMKQHPPQFLRSGDDVVAEIEAIGELRNRVHGSDLLHSGAT